MRLFRPAWESKDHKRALAAVRQITDQDKLTRIATTASREEIRIEAIERLTSQDTLAHLATTDDKRLSDSALVRQIAIKRLSDQALLAAIAETDSVRSVRLAAAERLTDQDWLLAVAQGKGNLDVRLAAARKLVDPSSAQRTFAEAIVSNRVDSVALEDALAAVTDESLLQLIGETARDDRLRLAAINRVADKDVAQRLRFEFCVDPGVALSDDRLATECIQPMDDQTTLAEIASRSRSNALILAAAARLDDPELADQAFARVAHDGGKQALEAIDRITSQDVLADLAQNLIPKRSGWNKPSGRDLSRRAFDRITDQAALTMLAFDRKFPWRTEAAKLLEDPLAALEASARILATRSPGVHNRDDLERLFASVTDRAILTVIAGRSDAESVYDVNWESWEPSGEEEIGWNDLPQPMGHSVRYCAVFDVREFAKHRLAELGAV